LLGLAFGFIACAKPAPPTVIPKAVRVTAVRPQGLELTLDLDVHNPNDFPLFVNSVDGTLALGAGVELGRAQAQPKSRIPAKGTSPISSQVFVAWTNLGALTPFLISQSPIDYRFRGTALLGGERLNLSVPFELTGTLTRAELIQIGLAALPR
jgi:LEA14-like dessication related protein